jgi:hypothetical protein
MLFKRQTASVTRADALATMTTEIGAAISKAAGHHVDRRAVADILEQLARSERVRDCMVRPVL